MQAPSFGDSLEVCVIYTPHPADEAGVDPDDSFALENTYPRPPVSFLAVVEEAARKAHEAVDGDNPVCAVTARIESDVVFKHGEDLCKCLDGYGWHRKHPAGAICEKHVQPCRVHAVASIGLSPSNVLRGFLRWGLGYSPSSGIVNFHGLPLPVCLSGFQTELPVEGPLPAKLLPGYPAPGCSLFGVVAAKDGQSFRAHAAFAICPLTGPPGSSTKGRHSTKGQVTFSLSGFGNPADAHVALFDSFMATPVMVCVAESFEHWTETGDCRILRSGTACCSCSPVCASWVFLRGARVVWVHL